MHEVIKSRRHTLSALGAETAIVSAMIHVTKKTIASVPSAALGDTAPAMATTIVTRMANINPATNPARVFILPPVCTTSNMLDSGIAAKRHCCPTKICHTWVRRRELAGMKNGTFGFSGARSLLQAQKKALLGKAFFHSGST
ncbi:hypothetical protein [Pseudomonas thivervalensis]|uniref:hypothetical protein n=1 Tax=Pseudomonas thivervalensis TaxID=86265 RepID=UPI003D965BCC